MTSPLRGDIGSKKISHFETVWDQVPSWGDPLSERGSELSGEGSLTWFQIPPTTVNLFAYLLTVSWQLTFMFKIKCLIDYFLEQWWDVVLYLSQCISGLSLLPFMVHGACVRVCTCACVHVCVCPWRLGKLEAGGKESLFWKWRKGGLLFQKLHFHKDFPMFKERWLILDMIQAESQRIFIMMILFYQKL